MAIKIENISKKYSDFYALKNVSITLEYGKIYCLIGDSGSGKSTFLKIVSGLLLPSDGTVTYDNKNIYQLSNNELSIHRNENVGFVFQDYFLEENLSVYENTMVPLLIRGNIKHDVLKETVINALTAVGMAHKMDQIVNTLSGGEKQRVSIARAIVGNPKIIFADEPTGNLDSTNGNRIMEVFLGLNLKGTTIMIVTHNENIANLIDNKIYIKDGSIIESNHD